MSENTPQPDEFGRYRVRDLDTGHERTINAPELAHGNYEVIDDPKDPASDPATGIPVAEKLAKDPVVAPAANDGPVDPPEPSLTPTAYDDWDEQRLVDEVEARSALYLEQDQSALLVDEPGEKPQLVAALVTDDARWV